MTKIEIPIIDLDSLYDLYVAYCDRTKTEPTMKDFDNWLRENNYVSN